MVYCVLCFLPSAQDEAVVHIFSTLEKAEAFAATDDRNHVFYDYLIDHPERMEGRQG